MSRPVPVLLCVLLLLAALPGVGGADPLYDVDFGTPPHSLGQPPTTGAGAFPRDVPTDLLGTGIEVVAGSGALSDQPAQLSGDATQFIGFSLSGSGFDAFQITLDLLPSSLAFGTEARLSVDTPSTNSMNFRWNGDIAIFDGDLTLGVVDTFTVGTLLQVAIDFDLGAGAWSIDVNGNEIHAGSLLGTLTAPAFRIGAFGNDYTILADNVQIAGVPEPSTGVLLAMGLGWIAARHRRA